MTNNIVAVFACNINKEYPVVNGSIFNEEYNETLDSATIVLSQVAKEDRLSNIKPYDYVRVYDKSGNTGFDKLYLVDNFNEQENNIKEHIFGYTINLMSETKILEKIQCPNLVITHDIKNGIDTRKTILEKIYEYMVLYVPKMKYSSDGINWIYEPVIKFDGLTKNYTKHTEEDETQRQDERSFYEVQDAWECEAAVYITDPDVDINTVHVLDYEIVNVEGYNPVEVSRQTVIVDRAQRKISFFILCDREPQNVDFYISFSYEYFEYSTIVIKERWKKFDVPCADMGFNTPTLRQLLTTLMQQVGCIPIVKNRTLDFLDFQLDAVDFAVNGDYSLNNTVNYIRRGLSSDSYVNSLVNISDNVLDSGNEVICETLGFRDKQNVLLKQEENLKLETSLPIYKINKTILKIPGRQSGRLSTSYGCYRWDTTNQADAINWKWPMIFYRDAKIDGNSVKIKLSFKLHEEGETDTYSTSFQVKINDNKIYFFKKNSNDTYSVIGNEAFDDFSFNASTSGINDHYQQRWEKNGTLVQLFYTWCLDKTLSSSLASIADGFMFSGTFLNDNEEEQNFCFIKFSTDEENVKLCSFDGLSVTNIEEATVAYYDLSKIGGFRIWDISPLVVENSVRQLLDRDFDKMATEIPSANGARIEELAKYVYGTVGYSIGSKEISGFSDTFTRGTAGLGWITATYTYIENIINVLQYDFDQNNEKDLIFRFFPFLTDVPDLTYYPTNNNPWPSGSDYFGFATILKLSFEYYNPTGDSFSTSKPFFTTCMFDIYYQPLNSFNLSYVKKEEDIDFPISQYNSNVSGLSDFDRLSTNEQEQVDRIGNEVLTINQRTNLYSNIRTFANGPLFFKDDTNRSGSIDGNDNGIKYIIFKRSFTIKNNFFNVTYVGSKDAVLKNYFTSIRTKYRAYQYVDYNQSVLRKERDTIFVRVANDYYDGDDKIWLGNYTEKKPYNIKYWIYDLYNESTQDTSISYECEKNLALIYNGVDGYEEEMQSTKNSVSLIATSNMMGIIYECVDNVGAGNYITNITQNEKLSGVPQSWQIWDDSYNERHTVSYVNYIDFLTSSTFSDGSSTNIKENIKNWQKSPIVDEDFINLDSSENNIFSLVDNNKISDPNYLKLAKTFYKDVSERINHTAQFIYYSPYNEILFGEDFISGTPMLSRFANEFNIVYGSTHFELNNHESDVSLVEKNNSAYVTKTISSSGYVNINANNITRIEAPDGLDDEDEPYNGTFTSMIGVGLQDVVIDMDNVIDRSLVPVEFSSNYLQDEGSLNIFIDYENESSFYGVDLYVPFTYKYDENVLFCADYVDFIDTNDDTTEEPSYTEEGTVDSSNIVGEPTSAGDDYKQLFKKHIGTELKNVEMTYVNEDEDVEITNLEYLYDAVSGNLEIYVYCPTTALFNDVNLTITYTYQKLFMEKNPNYNALIIYWHDYNVIKLCHKNSDNTVIDIAVFKRPSNNPESTIFYFTLNDTKSDYVMGERNGILYRAYRVANNNDSQFVSSARKVKPL